MSYPVAPTPRLPVFRAVRRWLPLVLVGGIAAACGSEEPSEQAPNTPEPQSTVLTPGPESFARIVDCFSAGDGEAVAACQDEFVRRYARETGRTSLQVLDDLEAARSLNPTLEGACHPMSHAIGRWVFETDGTVVGAFEKCNEACHSGCYHGVMERVFEGETDHPTLEEVKAKMPNICEPSMFPTPSLEFQCLHGIGHAVMYSLGYNLKLALETCNLLVNPGGPPSCHGAVFMENIAAAIPELRDLKLDDPHYPCNDVDATYARTCYGMQTSVMFGYLGMSVEQVADACLTGAGPYADTCMSSLGRDLSSYARVGQSELLRQPCEDLAGEHASSCIWGGVAALMDNTWDGSFAIPFCNYLHGDELRATCYYQTRWHLKNQYLFDDAAWLGQCDLYAGEHMDVCQALVPATP